MCLFSLSAERPACLYADKRSRMRAQFVLRTGEKCVEFSPQVINVLPNSVGKTQAAIQAE